MVLHGKLFLLGNLRPFAQHGKNGSEHVGPQLAHHPGDSRVVCGFNDAKVELAVGSGKQVYDKRQSLKKAEAKREMDRVRKGDLG